MKPTNITRLLCLLLLFASSTVMAEEAEKQYKYCFKVHFLDLEQIQSATVSGYDHPWYKLFRPREIHSVSFTSYGDRHCWKSELPEMGIAMHYVVKSGSQAGQTFRCRQTPDPMEKYKAKTWNLTIRKKKPDESYPVDCRIK